MNVSGHNDVVTRRPTLDDLQPVIDLINTCSVAEGGKPDSTAESQLEDWQSPSFSLDADAWVVVAEGGQIVGYEQVNVRIDGSPMELDGYVHPAHAGRGIGTHLLRLAEGRATHALAQADRRAPVSLRGAIASANAAARRLFVAEGYQLIRHLWRMEIELRAPPEPPAAPAGIAVRELVPGQDERAIYETIEAAFADHWEHVRPPFEEWLRARTQRADFDPSLWFLAHEGGEVVGAVLGYPRGERAGWVKGLGVRSPWRGRGVGMALLRHAFAAMYRRGWQTVGLGVDAESLTGATRLYERAGMRVTEQYEAYSKTL
ncbi:MAG: GNAT family N-acetyltransferase [Kouleothrix sp.]|nr:GNAT family N-acetyltransferase [Kouleothrix sp.]